MEPTLVSTYRRTVGASLARVWENVLDWEHLPWLHRETFRFVELLEQDADGWHVRTATHGAHAAEDIVLGVAVERAARRYHARTLAGPGTGTDILTRLVSRGSHATDIEVEFHVPDVDPTRAAAVGARYVALYTRLWDQDEAMIRRRQALLDGRLAASRRTVALDGAAVTFGTVCPHRGGPLDAVAVEDGCIACPWHGYRFDVRTGASADGRGLRLDGVSALPRS